MATMSFDEVKKIVYQYYPKNSYDTEPEYRVTAEFK